MVKELLDKLRGAPRSCRLMCLALSQVNQKATDNESMGGDCEVKKVFLNLNGDVMFTRLPEMKFVFVEAEAYVVKFGLPGGESVPNQPMRR